VSSAWSGWAEELADGNGGGLRRAAEFEMLEREIRDRITKADGILRVDCPLSVGAVFDGVGGDGGGGGGGGRGWGGGGEGVVVF